MQGAKILSWSLGNTQKEHSHNVLRHFDNYVNPPLSVTVTTRQPRSSFWWSLVLSRLNYVNAYWSASRPIFYDFSQC